VAEERVMGATKKNPNVSFYKATILYPEDGTSVPVDRAQIVVHEGKKSFLAEWNEENFDWSMRLVSTNGVGFRGTMNALGQTPIEASMQLWHSPDGTRFLLDGVFRAEQRHHWQFELIRAEEDE
jgi:hypothetical protein